MNQNVSAWNPKNVKKFLCSPRRDGPSFAGKVTVRACLISA